MQSLTASSFHGSQLRIAGPTRVAPRICTSIQARLVEGKVVSAKMDKTISVLVTRYKMEPRYGKRVLRTKKYHAHDENNECEEGDFVAIREVQRMSKTKTAVLDTIIRKVIKL
jgi:small subunit ribosomal protein S17